MSIEPPHEDDSAARCAPYTIEQTLSGSATPVRTVLGLRRAYGCFWVSL